MSTDKKSEVLTCFELAIDELLKVDESSSEQEIVETLQEAENLLSQAREAVGK